MTGQLGGDVAMLIRFHHVLADGMAALALLGALFDAAPEMAEPEAPPWMPRPAPTRWELLVDNLRRHIATVRVGLGQIEGPRAALGRGRTFVRQAAHMVREGRAPRVSFNRPVGRHQRLMLVRADLDRTRTVAHAHHATVNDVVLCAIAGGARAMLAARGELRRDLVLKVSVAASIRALTSETQTGNLVGIMVVPVPVGEPDPIRRLEHIARATAERKRLPPYQPAARFMQHWMVRVMNRQLLVNLLASNLPGPPASMYFAGAKILEVFQIGVVQGNLALAVGVLSYAGQLNGIATCRLVRYADDLVLMVDGTREQAGALLEQLAGRVQALGLQLKAEKTAITHIDEGFLFLGQRIVRRPKGSKRYVYTFVSNEALASVRRKVKALTGRSTTNLELSELIAALNPVLRGWSNYFRHAAAKRTFEYLGYYAWWRVGRWLRKKHPRRTWKQIGRRYTSNGTFQEKGVALSNPGSISVTRYRYRGARIPNPWDIPSTADPSGLRTYRASREEQRSLGRVQQALA